MLPPTAPAIPACTIGVFDSGFGGLTVLRELLVLIPGAHFLYLGDTARLPYGAKSQVTVARYAVEAARFLVRRGAELLVIACNTATALALEEIRSAVPVPVIGVIEPGARAAAEACTKLGFHCSPAPSIALAERDSEPNAPGAMPASAQHPERHPAQHPEQHPAQSKPGRSLPEARPITQPEILVLATAATVNSHAYGATCARFGLHATEKACPLLVPLVEEGWVGHPVTREVLRIYLSEAFTHGQPDAVLLGCTHYPLLAATIREILAELGSEAVVIDSAQATAHAALHHLVDRGSLPERTAPASFECFATDSVAKFVLLGSRFLGRSIAEVSLLDLGG